MKKIFSIFLTLFLILVSFSCKQGSSSSGEVNEIQVPIFAGVMNGRAVAELDREWDNEVIITDGLSPVITGLRKQEIDVDLTVEGSMYTYQENAIGDTVVNISVQLLPYWCFDKDSQEYIPGEPDNWDMVYAYVGTYNTGNEYYDFNQQNEFGLEGFRLVVYQDINNVTKILYWQTVSANYVVDNELISQYKIYMRMDEVTLEGDGSTFNYSANENMFVTYYYYNKLKTEPYPYYDKLIADSYEFYASSEDCSVVKNEESFTITLRNVNSCYRQGQSIDISVPEGNFTTWIDELGTGHLEKITLLYQLSTGIDNGLLSEGDGVHFEDTYRGYLALTPFILNPVTESITFTKTF